MKKLKIRTWIEKDSNEAIDYLNYIIRDCEKERFSLSKIELVSFDEITKSVVLNIKRLTKNEIARIQRDRSISIL